jgi:hypothetical protein
LGRKSILGTGLFLERKIYFWEQHAIGGRKETCKKRRKSSMQEEKKHGTHADRPNHVRVRVLDKNCNGYKPVE